MSLTVMGVSALRDNYIWFLTDVELGVAVCVDPGDAAPVEAFLERTGLQLTAILVTHHHWDHTNGIDSLCQRYQVAVFAPASEQIAQATHLLRGGDRCDLPGLSVTFEVLAIPGHTLGHAAYYGAGILFPGDTLFSVGCGRLFEGEPEQLYRSLQCLAELPGETLVYPAHEYTLKNCEFALQVEPDNRALQARYHEVQAAIRRGEPSLPTTIAQELATNPFLRCSEATVRERVADYVGAALSTPQAVLAALRTWKDAV